MDTDKLLEIGARGIHLLFETREIEQAFEQDADRLRTELAGRHAEVQSAIDALVQLDDIVAGRRLIGALDRDVRHVLVLLYFDLLDGHLRRGAIRH